MASRSLWKGWDDDRTGFGAEECFRCVTGISAQDRVWLHLRLGDEYLCDEDFREMCSSDWSRPIPPSLMAKVLLLQRHDDVSEAGAEMFRGRCKKPENEGVSPSSSSSEDLIRVRIPSS